MLAATDTEPAPWYSLRSNDKRRALEWYRSHFSLIPSENVEHKKTKLPKLSTKRAYDDRIGLERSRVRT